MTGLAGEPPSSGVASGGALAQSRPSGLKARVLSALVLMAAALAVTRAGGIVFALFWLVASVAILWEWQTLVQTRHRAARLVSGSGALAGGAALLSRGMLAPAAVLLLLGLCLTGALAEPGKRAMSGLGLAYAATLLLSVMLLRDSAQLGMQAIVWLFAVVWGTDIMAYFGGRAIGGPKLSPRVSPGKTWSGFLIGIASGSLLGWAVSPQPSGAAQMLLIGLVTGAVAQAGDLCESALKRRFGVKDASGLIPGHGGAMDRLDGFIAAAGFATCLGVFRFGVEAPAAGLFHW